MRISIPAAYRPALLPPATRQLTWRSRSKAIIGIPRPPSGSRWIGLSADAYQLSRRHNIGLPTDVQSFKPQQAKFLLDVKLSRRHLFSPYHIKYVHRKGHALEAKYLSRYSAKGRDPLWWQPFVHMDGSKGIVRSRAMNRVRFAFGMALARNGYDRSGRKGAAQAGVDVSGAGAASSLKEGQPQTLYGTVNLRVRDARGFMKLELPSVVDYLAGVVKRLEPELGKDEQHHAR